MTNGLTVIPKPDFKALLSSDDKQQLLATLLVDQGINDAQYSMYYQRFNNQQCQYFHQRWQQIMAPLKPSSIPDPSPHSSMLSESQERALTDWLMELFNHLFVKQNVELIRGGNEPEYIPATITAPARIEFAHGFFASALHEISHWCIAGQQRRTQTDFGYWYAPDGRTEAQQQAFERVEIRPQALECLFSLATHRPFRVSQDNLFAPFDTSQSTFAHDVYAQVKAYIRHPHTLPRDAKLLLIPLLKICQ